MALESEHAGGVSPTVWKKQADALKQVHGELCRLRGRVDDLQNGLIMTASAASQDTDAARDAHSNNGEELQNLYTVVRALQRDAGLHQSKVEDLTNSLGSVKASVEAALPHILSFVSDVCKEKPANKDDGAEFTGTRLEELFEQLRAMGIPLRYATCESQDALRTDIDHVETRMHDEVSKLRSTMGQVLRSKADIEEVNALIAKLLADLRARSVAGVEGIIDNTSLIKTPLGSARCLACDRKMDVVATRPNPWDRGGIAASWSPREPVCPEHAPAGPPVGYRQRRDKDVALPAIKQDGLAGSGGHPRPAQQP